MVLRIPISDNTNFQINQIHYRNTNSQGQSELMSNGNESVHDSLMRSTSKATSSDAV